MSQSRFLRTSAALRLAVLVVSLIALGGLRTASAQQRPKPPAKPAAKQPAPVDTISPRVDRARIAGDTNAKVWLIMASDFECPFCKDWHDANFAGIMRDYVSTGRVRLAFINFPLPQHKNALPAAEAAMCAGLQNKFWPLHESLFATQQKWDTMPNPLAFFDSLAGASGVILRPYRTCVGKHLTLPMIEADRERARRSGASSTPTFFIGNEVLAGSDANVRGALDAALGAAGVKKPD